jgi:hypothetical protein
MRLARDSSEKQSSSYQEQESQASITMRATIFLNEYIFPLLHSEQITGQKEVVAVISHGILLSVLWKTLSGLFLPQCISLGPDAHVLPGITLEYVPGLSNTGYLELDILPVENMCLAVVPLAPRSASYDVLVNDWTKLPHYTMKSSPSENGSSKSSPLTDWQMVVVTVNGRQHLSNLKRTRGVGSTKHDKRQKRIENFFNKTTRVPIPN